MALLIAVAARPNGEVAPNISRTHQWQVFQVQEGEAPELAWTVLVQDQQALFLWQDESYRHPLAMVDAVIATDVDSDRINELKRLGIPFASTSETDTLMAVEHYVQSLNTRIMKPFPKAC